jgi:hypothetical protein
MFFTRNLEEVVLTEKFNRMSLQLLTELLQGDDVAIDEIDLFHALIRWCLDEKEIQDPDSKEYVDREVFLPRLARFIRYPLLSDMDFEFEVVPKQILTEEDVLLMHLFYER